ncbi:hypothetical protein ACSBR2_034599 [Camellia fascicularis]
MRIAFFAWLFSIHYSLDLLHKYCSISVNLLNWTQTNDCCSWKGFLQNLNWAHNNFTFTQIPPGFSKLTRLTYLNLSNANVPGQIPIELLYMTNLVTLDLSTLYFSRVPSLKLENPNLLTLVQNLTGLKQLLLDGVNISSSLPYLQILSLSNCYLSGPIDSSLQKLQFLSDIRLSQNNLSALVREIFADLPNLRSLHLCFSSLY